MPISQILGYIAAALIILILPRARSWLLLGFSIFAVFLVQPALPIRNLDFWLPTFTLGITIFTWIATRDFNKPIREDDIRTILLIVIILLVIGLNRYFGSFCCILPSRSPIWSQVLTGLSILIIVALVLWCLRFRNITISNFLTILFITLFVVLKNDLFAQTASRGLRILSEQQVANASAFDVRWIGFSYVTFRLIHVLRDRTAGRMKDVSLKNIIVYTIFFPTFTAGPIDRIQRFILDFDSTDFDRSAYVWQGGFRISVGMFKKFVLADTLALIALNDVNAVQTTSTMWLWVLVFVYAFRLYFDFSGYTDIAIGLGKLMGFNLPENFNQPYLKTNLTQFWNSWHITLAQWFRTYYFNPITRRIRSNRKNIPVWAIILFGQVSTMLLIGLWHGITLNFFIWGLWHGIGLFIHNRWSDKVSPKLNITENNDAIHSILKSTGVIFTFLYVSIGWVWFALSTPELSWDVLNRLIGF